MIEASSLNKTFRVAHKQPGIQGTLAHLFRRQTTDLVAVRDVSLTIDAGEVVGFLGQNGAGKTTTLKMLSGLLLPTAGRVVVDGFTPFERRSEFLRRMTLVMGNKQQLLWDLPVLDTLRMNAAIYGLSAAQQKSRIDELSALLAMQDKLTQPVRKLSLGERMKAELMAALLHEPRVLFLDEPTLGLDINAQHAVRAFLKAYNQRTGATILLTSHYMNDIVALCSRVLVIHGGTLVHDGTLAALQSRFQSDKRVTLAFADASAAEVAIATLATTDARQLVRDGATVVCHVSPDRLNDTMQHLLQRTAVVDFSVSDPPIEDVIGAVIGAPLTGATP